MHWTRKFAARLWTRQKPDGKKAAGAGRILLFVALFIGGAYWSVTRMAASSSGSKAAEFTGADKVQGPNPVVKDVQVAEIAAAAQEGREPDLQKGPKEELATSVVGVEQDRKAREAGYFGGTSHASKAVEEPNGGSIFDALAQTEEPAPSAKDGRRSTRDSLEIRGNDRVPAPVLGGGNGSSRQVPPIESLIVRNVRPTEVSANGGEQSTPAQDTRPLRDRTAFWLPRGELVRVYLMNDVQTGQEDALVEFAVAETVWFNGRPVLPFGTRFLATVARQGVRDRVNFTVDALRRRDGVSVPVKAVVLGEDRFGGMKAYYIPPPTMVQLAPYLGSFASSFAELVKDKVTERTAAGVTNLATNSVGLVGNASPPLEDTVKEAAVYATAKAIGAFIENNVKELNERHAPYLYVVSGSFALVQFREDTDLTPFWDSSARPSPPTVKSGVGASQAATSPEQPLASDATQTTVVPSSK